MMKPAVSRKPHIRRVYWNEPEMGLWERFYLFEIVRGLSITGGVFLRNMWKWCTGRKGARHRLLPGGDRAPTTPPATAASTC